jgi:trans,polycis-polyprenyl diphosphate synthase
MAEREPRRTGVRPPDPHPSGVRPPSIPPDQVPRHVALVMDGDGRWAKKRGLPRTEGHKQGESSLLDVIMGAIELGIPYLSAYAFSTENWRRSPDEVRFLMGFNRDVIHRRRDLLNEMGVRIRWAGRRPRLWRSVIKELEYAEQLSAGNSVLTLQFCVNYGGRAEIADAAAAIAADVAAGKLRADKITEQVFARYLDEPEIPEVDLFVRSSGEQRLSNFLLWQSAYAELVFLDTLWPDFDRRHLWHACEIYASRDRRYGGAVPNSLPAPDGDTGPQLRHPAAELLLLAVNLYGARDVLGHGDRTRGLAVCGAPVVLRALTCDDVCPDGYGYREATIGANRNEGLRRAVPAIKGYLSG